MLNRHKNWLVHKQTAYGKDFSNPFMVDNLPKIVGFSTHLASCLLMHHVMAMKHWLVQKQTLTIPEQTTTGKGISNPLMDGSLPKNYKANLVVLLLKRCCCVAERTELLLKMDSDPQGSLDFVVSFVRIEFVVVLVAGIVVSFVVDFGIPCLACVVVVDDVEIVEIVEVARESEEIELVKETGLGWVRRV
ncbi:hypothetical protein Tco_1038184 [Tanacetum coccineum]